MAEMSEYCVGSKVRMTKDDEFAEGTICFVVRQDNDGVPKLQPEGSSERSYVSDKYFEVIDKHPDDSQDNSPPDKLRMGDLVEVTGGSWFDVGDICTIADDLNSDAPQLKRLSDNKRYYVLRKNFKLTNQDNGENTMSDLINEPLKALRDVDLDEDTATLRKYGFENSEGRRTSTADTAMLDQMWKEQRTTFATRLRDLEAKNAPEVTPSV